MRSFKLKFTISILFLFAMIKGFSTGSGGIRVSKLISDNMVIQQGIPFPVWGYAEPGEKVEISMAGNTVLATAANDKKWMAHLPAMDYGGPYQIKIKGGGSELCFSNAMVGEVWLASGQSNMNFRVKSVINAEQVLREAEYPLIREFAVPMVLSKTPKDDLDGGKWAVCNPETVEDFSAVAYFFARSLHLKKKVAVGIIHASWGGTPVEAWTSAEKLKTHPDFKKLDEVLSSPDDWIKLQEYNYKVEAERENIIQTARNGLDMGVEQPSFDDSQWSKMSYPSKTTSLKAPAYSILWFRKSIILSESEANNDFELLPGKLIESDIIYFNGAEIGRGRNENKSYPVPQNLVRSGENVIAIRLVSQWSNGQFGNIYDNPVLQSRDKEVSISLKGEWCYNVNIEPSLPTAPNFQNTPSVLFNAMIHPLIPYPIKGAIWYQGETNSGRYEQYRALQPLLFSDWREQWKLGDLPFLFVQLPGLINTSWQWMREAQATSLKYPKTGMAVSMDVGDPYELHPQDKEPIGERLALLARQIAYGEDIVCYGPAYDSFVAEGSAIYLQFKNVGGGLITNDHLPLKGFSIAGKDKVFYDAEAAIIGDEVIVRSSKVKDPVAVRYAWTGIPIVNFYNKEGLPAWPFRTDNWAE